MAFAGAGQRVTVSGLFAPRPPDFPSRQARRTDPRESPSQGTGRLHGATARPKERNGRRDLEMRSVEGTIRSAATTLRTWRERARCRRELRTLNHRTLADGALSRDEAMKPFWLELIRFLEYPDTVRRDNAERKRARLGAGTSVSSAGG